ncbi:MAG: outer membrane protein transport protein [Gammaproteobacteria bacterium]
MQITPRSITVLLGLVICLAFPYAHATNGYFKIGYGSKNRGMAGAGVAFGQDATAAATNPATMADVGHRADAGIEVFSPRRESKVDATGLGVPGLGSGANTGTVESGADYFLIPSAGYVKQLENGLTVGISFVANGGMNTRYNRNLYSEGLGSAIPAFATALMTELPAGLGPDNPGITPAMGVNLAQGILLPTVAKRLNDVHTIGASLLIGVQTFRSYGLGLFQGLSSRPDKVTNNGNDWAAGLGARIGWTGKFTDKITVGASAASKIYMTEFDDYKGLFAEDGDFDVPANFSVGIAVRPTAKITVAFDVLRILYSDIRAINNKGPTADELLSAFVGVLTDDPSAISKPLGSDSGWGFGWENITVYKLGIDYVHNDKWTFRGGVNYGEQPYDDKEVLFNILAPAVVKTHLTLGFSYSPSPRHEITMTYMRAVEEDQSFNYTSAPPGFPPQAFEVENGMDQYALEAAYAWRF